MSSYLRPVAWGWEAQDQEHKSWDSRSRTQETSFQNLESGIEYPKPTTLIHDLRCKICDIYTHLYNIDMYIY